MRPTCTLIVSSALPGGGEANDITVGSMGEHEYMPVNRGPVFPGSLAIYRMVNKTRAVGWVNSPYG